MTTLRFGGCSRQARTYLLILLTLLVVGAYTPARARAGTTVLRVCPSGCDYATIQSAVDAAPTASIIEIGAGTYQEHVTITRTLYLEGESTAGTIVDGGGSGIVITIGSYAGNATPTVWLRQLTIQNGETGIVSWAGSSLTVQNAVIRDNHATNRPGAGILSDIHTKLVVTSSSIQENSTDSNGGGISSVGVVTINNSTIISNTSGMYGGAISNGTTSRSTLTVRDSTLAGNQAAYGGAISNQSVGTLWLIRSSVHDNSASFGGGIYNTGLAHVVNSTISRNAAETGGGVASSPQGSDKGLLIASATIAENSAVDGGGISFSGILKLKNTIVAKNTAQTSGTANCRRGSAPTSLGYNLADDRSCRLNAAGDRVSSDPIIESLGDNGGGTLSHRPSKGSPAINRGNPDGCTTTVGKPISTDQRRLPRADRCDIGAVERQR